MNQIIVNEEKCMDCGLCLLSCTTRVLEKKAGKGVVMAKPGNCIACGHCSAVCPSGAISYSKQDTAAPPLVDHSAITADIMENFLASKRSSRNYSSNPVDSQIIEQLLRAANMAPSSKNCQERVYIVVYHGEKLSKIKLALIENAKKVFSWLSLAVGRIPSFFMHPEETKALKKIVLGFRITLERAAKGEDSIFHDAPCVIFICGIKKDPLGKDNALAAQQYLMMQAEAMGLGTCIIGYAQSAPKVLAKHLDVPKFFTVYGAVTVGWPKVKYKRTVERKAPEIQWHGQSETIKKEIETGRNEPERLDGRGTPKAA